MKVLVSIMIITIGVLVFFIVGNDSDIQIDSPVSPQQSLDAYNLNDHEDMPAQHTETSSSKSEAKSNESNKVYAKNTSSSSSDDRSYQDTSYNNQGNSNYGNTSSSYNQSNSNYPGTGSSYSQSNTGNGNASSSYNQNNSNYDRTSSTSSSNSQTTSSNTTNTTSTEKSDTANNDQNDANSENTETAEETNATEEQEDINNTKYQRLYDNGIMWSGNTGMLMVEYQSSDAQTTGIGFRVHYDSSAIRPINVQQFPVDAIIQTSPQTVMADTSNRDNNTNTDQYLPFAWASIYGQWPQTNQVTLATIEFERVEGGSANDTINYTAVSVPAGFRLIK
ncbi:MAG: hypothetical protein ACON4S_02050 [Porticoccaceae bacterium]